MVYIYQKKNKITYETRKLPPCREFLMRGIRQKGQKDIESAVLQKVRVEFYVCARVAVHKRQGRLENKP